MSKRTVKARFVATFEVDLDDWNAEYGMNEAPDEVRSCLLRHMDDLARNINGYKDDVLTITTNYPA